MNGSQAESSVRRPLVLVVDDEDMIRSLIRSVLEANGYRVLEAESAQDALDRTDIDFDTIDLIITDVRMPGLSGPEFARVLRARRPDLPIVFVSGYSGDAPVDANPSAITEFLAKPFPLPHLIAAVRRISAAEPVEV